jgi:hypothetical protein
MHVYPSIGEGLKLCAQGLTGYQPALLLCRVNVAASGGVMRQASKDESCCRVFGRCIADSIMIFVTVNLGRTQEKSFNLPAHTNCAKEKGHFS